MPNESDVAQIVGLGFSRAHAVRALKATDNMLDRAADWVFSHPDEISDDSASGSNQPSEPEFRDGNSGMCNPFGNARKKVNQVNFIFLFFFSPLFRSVPSCCFHLSHGNFNYGWALCMSHSP